MIDLPVHAGIDDYELKRLRLLERMAIQMLRRSHVDRAQTANGEHVELFTDMDA